VVNLATQINKTKFLENFEADLIYDVFNVTVGTEQRVYGKTRIRYQVVYAVV